MTMGEEPATKLEFDRMIGFKFTAAYEAYSKLFDEVEGLEEKRELNDNISKLFNDEISYPRFYSELNQYREDSKGGREFRRVRIQGQRKRAYRRDEQKKDRIKRHRR